MNPKPLLLSGMPCLASLVVALTPAGVQARGSAGAPLSEPTAAPGPAVSQQAAGPSAKKTGAGQGEKKGGILQTAPAPLGPPGTVFIPPQQIVLGAPLEELEKLLEENAATAAEMAPNLAPEYAGETKRRPTLEVPGFFLQSTEVTSEQYLEFVRSTGHRPPIDWGTKAIDEAQAAFVKADFEAREAAKREGKPVPPATPFDRIAWWQKNHSTSTWALPEGQEAFPVVNVDFQDADAYARWAGLRLMTEFEFQAAGGRGADKQGQRFPWGNEWIDGLANTSERHRGKTTRVMPAGASPGAVSPFGVHDLSGNVWEWTASPFKPLIERWKTETIEVGPRGDKVALAAPFDADQRVVVGGAYVAGQLTARLTTRRGTDRFKIAAATGFRCAADMNPLATSLQNLIDSLPPGVRGAVDLDPASAAGRYRWKHSPGKVSLGAVRTQGGTGPEVSSSYAVITGFESFAFLPAAGIEARSLEALGQASLEKGPVPLGILTISVPLAKPALEPGTYLVAYRAAGEPAAAKKPDEEPAPGEAVRQAQEQEPAPQAPGEKKPNAADEAIAGLRKVGDLSKQQLFFFDLDGQPVLALGVEQVEAVRTKKPEPTRLTLIPYEPPKFAVKEEDKGPEHDTARFEIKLLTPSKSEQLVIPLALEVQRGTFDGWRE
jgi:formylglycine-generating enzyme required for sulfatase activity